LLNRSGLALLLAAIFSVDAAVYESAPARMTAFVATISKSAVIGLLLLRYVFHQNVGV
jgi:hypothetical protein